jgi:hypothetical protein
MAFSLALSSDRSGVPGAYDRFGSFVGCGTRRTPAKAAFKVMGAGAVTGWDGVDSVVTIVDMVNASCQVKRTILSLSAVRRPLSAE